MINGNSKMKVTVLSIAVMHEANTDPMNEISAGHLNNHWWVCGEAPTVIDTPFVNDNDFVMGNNASEVDEFLCKAVKGDIDA